MQLDIHENVHENVHAVYSVGGAVVCGAWYGEYAKRRSEERRIDDDDNNADDVVVVDDDDDDKDDDASICMFGSHAILFKSQHVSELLVAMSPNGAQGQMTWTRTDTGHFRRMDERILRMYKCLQALRGGQTMRGMRGGGRKGPDEGSGLRDKKLTRLAR
jgi:hypothetical protein